MTTAHIQLPQEAIGDLCRRYHIRRLALFGSVLRDDFRPDSDVDILYDFDPDAHMTLLDVVTLQEELQNLLGRPVDLASYWGIEHSESPTRRRTILSSAQVVYET